MAGCCASSRSGTTASLWRTMRSKGRWPTSGGLHQRPRISARASPAPSRCGTRTSSRESLVMKRSPSCSRTTMCLWTASARARLEPSRSSPLRSAVGSSGCNWMHPGTSTSSASWTWSACGSASRTPPARSTWSSSQTQIQLSVTAAPATSCPPSRRYRMRARCRPRGVSFSGCSWRICPQRSTASMSRARRRSNSPSCTRASRWSSLRRSSLARLPAQSVRASWRTAAPTPGAARRGSLGLPRTRSKTRPSPATRRKAAQTSLRWCTPPSVWKRRNCSSTCRPTRSTLSTGARAPLGLCTSSPKSWSRGRRRCRSYKTDR
mmetsp:Transcript_128046/g.370561  ORF Transcript_128046/g.370561 Transcript_128046/m.370561 type:complete len:321 (+) Transcript_128046:1056-2018(+)